MNHITEKVLLTPETCEVFKEALFASRLYWLDRGSFYTLGASAYIDDPCVYPGLAANCNGILEQRFKYLSSLVANWLKEEFNREVIVFPNKGLPGFHIFTSESNGHEASIHTDEAHDRLVWGCEVADAFSFTLVIDLPKCGGGLNWWKNQADADNEMLLPTHQPYTVGTAYLFAADVPHQIANDGDLGDDEYRITYQGHGVTLDTGKIAVYF